MSQEQWEGLAVPEAIWAGENGKEGKTILPLVLVPFKAVLEEESEARNKQATKARKLQALTAAHDVLYATPGRLGRIEGARAEANASEADHSEEEASEGLWPYVPDWPRVIMGSNLSSAEDKLEWLQNCFPPNVLEGYKELGANSVIGLSVQSALLIRGGHIE